MDWLRSKLPGGSYKYTALQGQALGGRKDAQPQAQAWSRRSRTVMKVAFGSLIVAAGLYALAIYTGTSERDSCDSTNHGFQCDTDISHSWGQYSPFYSVHSNISRATPKGCEVTFAQALSRHGARDPTIGKTLMYAALIARIQSSVTDYGKHFKFIKDYNYTLGSDQLTLFGEQQMVNSGVHFYRRYKDLALLHAPFVRTAGQNRVVGSARNWTQGFHLARTRDERPQVPEDGYPYDILVIPEGPNINNTLSHEICSGFRTGPGSLTGYAAQAAWLDVFAPPITKRLNENLPGADLTDLDTVQFMELCPFNTVADDLGRLSRFCRLFTRDEWRSYDYYESLGKWYGFSNGNALGPTLGVGFVNELIARLTQQPVKDHTDTNSTLDSSPETFPLTRKLYADFSHDNDMAGIFAALGLFNATEPLSNTTRMSPKETNGYSASWTVPFAARMYVEKMRCGEDDEGAEELVRILVNDRVIPLQNCDADDLGRCELSKFVESLSFARGGGNWDACFQS